MLNRVLALILLVVTALSGCSQYNRIQKHGTVDQKLELAVNLYNKGQYYKALPLFEELITIYRGTRKAEKTYYYYAYCNYKLEDYETAAYDFENFTKTFPASEFAEECAYMHAYCFYQNSPEYSLDQTSTHKAMVELQLFINRYPTSSRVEQCNGLLDQLREKLELKDYENARMYYNLDNYKAAVTAFKNILHDYPTTRRKEEAMFLILKAGYRLAENSIDTKKTERYDAALSSYQEFVQTFPESKYRKEADDISSSIHRRMEKLQSRSKV